MKFAPFLGLAAFIALAACSRQDAGSHATDVTGALPALDFTLTRANDGREVHGGDYAGKIAILYFGYTHCPDICPTTLSDLADALRKLGPRANEVRVLFVTVDPNRDTLDAMKGYVASFAPQIDGLRVTPGPPYEVMHSNAVFIFDRTGRARLVTTDVSKSDEVAADLKKVLGQ